jgi:MFS family permease
MLISKDVYVFNKFFKTTAITTFFYSAIYTYLFLLTPYLTSIGWSDTYKGLFFAIFSAVGIIAAPVVGTLSDKLGRFNIIIAGLILEVVALFGYIHITSPLPLLALRLLSAIAFNAIVISSLSRIQDVSDSKHRSSNTGIYSSLLAIATILAPLLGGFIADAYGYTAVFQVAQVIMVSILISLAVYDKILFRKQNYSRASRAHERFEWSDLNPFKHIRMFFKHEQLHRIGLLGMFVNFSIPLFTLVLPYLAIELYGFTNTQLSLIILFRGIALLFQFEIGRIPVKVGTVKGMIAGTSTTVGGLLFLFFSETFAAFCIGLFIMGIGGALWNLSVQSYMADIGEALNIEGEVIGTYHGISRFSITLSFFLSGLVLSIWQKNILLAYSALHILGIFVFAVPLLRMKRKECPGLS